MEVEVERARERRRGGGGEEKDIFASLSFIVLCLIYSVPLRVVNG